MLKNCSLLSVHIKKARIGHISGAGKVVKLIPTMPVILAIVPLRQQSTIRHGVCGGA